MSASLLASVLTVSGVAPVILGPIALQGFEVPESITIGGAQRLAIHRLPGGARVIDALGPDDAEVTWSGIATGPDAVLRIRILDTLRRSGLPVPLAWDAHAYTVLVSNFEADTASPYWIPYRIACTALQDDTAVPLGFTDTLTASLFPVPDLTRLDAKLAAAAPALYADDLATGISASGDLARLAAARSGLSA